MVGRLFSVLHEIARPDSPSNTVPKWSQIRGDRIPSIAPYLVDSPNPNVKQQQEQRKELHQQQVQLEQQVLPLQGQPQLEVQPEPQGVRR